MRKKVLYAVQATGNGHLSRCMEFYPILAKYADVDVLLSGIQGDLELPFPVKYKKHGLGFIFGKHGGINYFKTVITLKPLRLIRDILSLDLKPYDLIVNDFEPISAWAARFARKECVALSHQASFLTRKTPRPKHRNWFAEFVFKYFAPANRKVGLHFKSYADFIYTPIVRSEIRSLKTNYNPKEAVVYLPSFGEEIIIEKLSPVKNINWNIFSKHTKKSFSKGNINVYPISRDKWAEKLKVSASAIVGAGFEGSSEMLYLKKRLMVLPMTDQYEQLCNAEALKKMGVTVVYKVDETFSNQVEQWITEKESLEVDFPKRSEEVIKKVLGI